MQLPPSLPPSLPFQVPTPINKTSIKMLFFFCLCIIFPSLNAFNITKILEQYPDFSSFNTYLSQNNLASQINSRQTITVLAVDNDNLSPISGKSPDTLKAILSIHVVLDYYDPQKLQKISNKTAILTTLFQSSGQARGQQGFLNVTVSSGNIAFGSAAPGSPIGANLVKSVDSEPYNVSVLQVSSVIIPPGIDGSTNSSTSSPPPPSKAQSPSSPPTPSASANSSEAPTPSAEVPSAADGPAESDAPALSPVSDPDAIAPVSDAPVADTPSASAPAEDVPASEAPTPSAGPVLHVSLSYVFVPALATFLLRF